MTSVSVGKRSVGDGQPCLIAAEIGINHNGDMDLALRTIDAAADAGADAVKFQNYVTEDFVSDQRLTYSYTSGGREVTETQYAMFKRCELAPGSLALLKSHSDRRGLLFFSTPTGPSGIAELVAVGAALVKNGSDFLTHVDMVRTMAASGIPTVLSTGMATLAEVDSAVRNFRQAGGTKLVLLHCTSSYPAPADDINLRRMATLRAAFGCPVGFSDHSQGVLAAANAAVLGACLIEKHFTLDRSLPGPDHWFSSDPAELAALVRAVRDAERMLGTPQPGPTASEEASRLQFRLSCTARRAMAAGTKLASGDVVFRRPGTGISPDQREALIGLTLVKEVHAGDTLTWAHF